MKTIFTYIPIISLLLVLYALEDSILKWMLLIICALLVVLAKYIRTKMKADEIEFDDRVNANISKWSLRSVYLLNAFLVLLLVLDARRLLTINLNNEMLLLYLLLTLYVPFYIVPLIVKKF
ncbi:hypothetical protein CJ483_03335 [Bacillus sp. PK3_68]|nr:hypothetical protein CJ483_03335 [Bacillus sp. PK3_68]